MQRQFRNLVCVAATLITASIFSSPALADGADIISPFPISGAYSADFRQDRERISIIEFSGDYDKSLNSGEPNAEPRAVIAQEFFRNQPDTYDFLVVFSTFEFDTGDALAFHWPVRNSVKGIGKPEFDVTHLFGSDGKLLGYTDMAAFSRWVTDPMDPKFEEVLATLSHEILHQWSAKVRFREADGTLSEGLLGKDGSHWSYLLDSDGSVEYGSDWRDNGNGTFTAVGTGTFYSPLDLYLMGMYRPDEVPPMTLIENPEIDKTGLPEQGMTISGASRTVTIEDIIAAEGPRVPDVQNSQKEFRMAFLLLTTPGEKVGDETIQGLNNIRNAFMTRFSVLTAGRAMAQIHPEATPIYEAGAPTTIGGGEVSSRPADLEAALQWLQQEQTGEGFWADKPATRVRDTAVTLGVLSKYSAGFQGLPVAAEWLAAVELTNFDDASRAQAVLAVEGFASGVEPLQLASLRNEDGGWGVAGGYASDPLDTALAVVALVRQGAGSGAIQAGVDYLSAAQNDDGGWSGAAGGASRVSVTAEVLHALHVAERRDLPALDKALSWVASRQNGDGGFGDAISTIHESAATLLALTEHGALDRVQPDQVGQYLLERQTVDGSWARSSYTTALVVAALKNFSFSNWKVESVSSLPAEPRDGERVRISAVVRNDSAIATPGGVLRFYDGDPAAGGATVGYDITIPLMASGSALSFTTLWDSFGKSGTHTFFALVDPDETVVETSERDNSGSIEVPVLPAPEIADLEITDTDITFMPGHPNRLPTTLGVNANLRNLGLRDAAGLRVLLWDGDAGTGTVVGETTLDVANRTTVVANFNYVLNRAGVTRLTVQLDPDGAIAEAREDNNIASAEVVLDPSVDLSVTADDISRDKTLVQRGDNVAFTVKLHNHGTSPSPASTVSYSITDGNGSREVLNNSVEIDPGETITHTVPVRVLVAGPTTFSVTIDGEGQVAELDETNNSASVDFDVAAVEGPNLVASHTDFHITPDPADEAAPLLLTGTVRNAGTEDALDVVVAFYNGDPAQGGTALNRQNIPRIPAGQETTISFKWDSVPDSADKLLFVVADPENLILEYNENDNAAFNTVRVRSLPDLAISVGDIELSPAHPRVGEPVTIAARVSNLGQQAAENILVRAFDDDPATGGSLIGERIIASLPAATEATINFSTIFESDRADRPIVVQVDPEGNVLETNRENNTARRNVAVQDGDVYVTQRYFSPNGDGVQDETEIVFKLAQSDTVSIEVVSAGGNIVRSFAGEGLAGITEGSVTWDGLDNNGGIAADGDYKFRLYGNTGGIIAEAQVALDTNRLSVLKAIELDQAYYTNLTCKQQENTELALEASGETGYFFENGYLYKSEDDGSRHTKIFDVSQTGTQSYSSYTVNRIIPSADGRRIFFTVHLEKCSFGYLCISEESLWVIDAEGGNPIQLRGKSTTLFDVLVASSDGRYILSQKFFDTLDKRTVVTKYSADGFQAPVELLVVHDYNHVVRISPTGEKIAVKQGDWRYMEDVDSYEDSYEIAIIDVETGEKTAHLVPEVLPAEYDYGVEDLLWSPDGAHLAVPVFNSLKFFDAVGNRIGGSIGTASSVWLSSGKIFAQHYQSSRIVDLKGGELELSLSADVVGWEESEPALMTFSTSFGALFLSDNRHVSPLPFKIPPRASEAPEDKPWFTTGGELVYRGYPHDDPACVERENSEADLIRVSSYLNLSAEIDSVRSSGGIRLRGTASDKHFKNYLLEYAPAENPGDWHPVGPASNQAVIDGTLGFWVPPGVGTYIIRLSVTDLAGNTQSTSKRVYWSEPSSISDLYTDPPVFSPNGDGALDVARIHYRVLEPTHLEFSLYNDKDELVRSYVRDHITVGSQHDILWDGLNQYGILLPDGMYTLRVQNYRFPITIDNTRPEVRIAVRDAYQFQETESGERFVDVNPGLIWQASDRHLESRLLEIGRITGSTEWSHYTLPSVQGLPDAAQVDIPLETAANSRFRLTASDRAANTERVTSDPAVEQLIISAFGKLGLKESVKEPPDWKYCSKNLDDVITETDRAHWIPLDLTIPEKLTGTVRPEPVRISVAETVGAQLVQVYVQYREHGGSDWAEMSVEEYLIRFDHCALSSGDSDGFITAPAAPEHRMEIRWNIPGSMAPNAEYDLRLRGIDAQGNVHISNVIGFYLSDIEFSFNGRVRDIEDSESIKPIVMSAVGKLTPPWNLAEEELFWGHQTLDQPIGEIRLILESTEDPRYATPRIVDTMSEPGELFLFRVADLRACKTYRAHAEVYSPGGIFSTPELLLSSHAKVFRMPCLELEADVATVFAQACGEASPNELKVKLTPKVLDNSGLKLLTLFRYDAEGREDVLYNVNQPLSGRTYEHVIDSEGLAEGPVELTARLVNLDDDAVTEPVNLTIDHTPAVVDITYPAEGQRVCGIPQKGIDGIIRNVLKVSGEVVEAGGWHYVYEVNDIPVHNSRLRDSFLAAAGEDPWLDPRLEPLHKRGSYLGPVAALSNRDGEIQARMRVFDESGHQQCIDRSFYFDGAVESARAYGNRRIIAPVMEGDSGSLIVTYESAETATVDVGIHEAGTAPLHAPIGPLLRTLLVNQPLLPGAGSVAWNGRDSSGSLVSDGMYVAVVNFEDSCGNQAQYQVVVEVDNTAPEQEITSPLATETLPLMVEVSGSVSDKNFKGYELKYGIGTAPETWSLVARETSAVTDDILGRWNTYGLVGEVTLRMTATDIVGNTTEFTRTFTLPERHELLTGLETTPAVFSPNGDGRSDSTTGLIGIAAPANVTVEIVSAEGASLRTLQNAGVREESFQVLWDGKDEEGRLVSDGAYRLRVTAVSQTADSLVQSESVTVTVDTTPPAVDITSPVSGYGTESIGVEGTIADENLLGYSVEISGVDGQWREIAYGQTSRTENGVLADLSGLQDGAYTLRVVAVDGADNRTERLVSFLLDNIPPEIGINAPVGEDVLRGSAGALNVSASVIEEHPAFYSLLLGEGGSPEVWTEVVSGESLPLPEPLAVLDVSALTEGVHTLMLAAEDRAGNRNEKRVTFTLDNTAPEVSLLSPADGAMITGPISVVGWVTDTNLEAYQLYIAVGDRDSASRWDLLASGDSAVIGGVILGWSELPPDGRYTLKLVGKDKAGNAMESLVVVNVTVDPPEPPTGLVASVEGSDLYLQWDQSDVKGYHVYRDNTRLTSEPIGSAEYLDSDLSDGVYRYAVRAVDYINRLSLPSNSASVTLDRTPPEAAFVKPSEGASVGGTVAVMGTADSLDFKAYRLFVGRGAEPASWELLRESPLRISDALLAEWDTTQAGEGETYTLKLETEDLSGNQGLARLSVVIDNAAPAAPTGLVAADSGDSVQLTWNANSEADLLGYLVFRNGELLGASDVGLDLRPYVQSSLSFSDIDLSDGAYEYAIAAIDETGNVSGFSLPAKVSIDTQPPHAVITSPEDGAAFDWPLYILAESTDGDVAKVVFEYREQAGSEWKGFNIDTGAPFETTFDPAALNLSYGNCEIRAVATDLAGKIDPSPAPVQVTYRDLTPPDALVGFTAHGRGGEVNLQWQASDADDLAGYRVYRADTQSGDYTLVNVELLSSASYTQNNLGDGDYAYYVTAVDTSDNESNPSTAASVTVYALVLFQPYTPTQEEAVVVKGSSPVAGTLFVEVSAPSGTRELASREVGAESEFSVDSPLEEGANAFSVYVRDAAGNISKRASVSVVRGTRPSRPTGLTGTSADYQVTLSWMPNPEVNIAGYRVFRGEDELSGEVELLGLSATASHNEAQAESLFDSPYNSWETDPSAPNEGQWISIRWPEPKLISSVQTQWTDSNVAYDIQVWDGSAWVPMQKVLDNSQSTSDQTSRVFFPTHNIELPALYPTDRIRIVFRESEAPYVAVLMNVRVWALELNESVSYMDTSPDGIFAYTVTAINDLGFESDPSEPATVAVGDTTAPDPVALSATVDGSNVQLTWSTGASGDVARYDIYRDDQKIGQINDPAKLSYIDTGLLNGSYEYTLRALDGVGNESDASNRVTAVVAVELLPAPENLLVEDIPTGVLQLSWSAAPGSEPTTYRVLRSLTSGGPYTAVWEGSNTNLTDSDVLSGETYYYVVAAVDAVGNPSDYSAEGSATSRDEIAPAMPVITYPTGETAPFETQAHEIVVAGSGEPNTIVSLYHNGSRAGETRALPELRIRGCEVPYSSEDSTLSPDGRYVAFATSGYIRACALEPYSQSFDIPGSNVEFMHWTEDAASLVFKDVTTLKRFNLRDHTVTDIMPYGASEGRLSPDGTKLFYGDTGWTRRLHVYDLETKQDTRFQFGFSTIEPATIRWSPDGRHVAFNAGVWYYVVDVNTRSYKKVGYGSGIVQWVDGGATLLFSEYDAIVSYSVADGTKETISDVPGHKAESPVLSPDGKYLAYFLDRKHLLRRDRVTGEEVELVDGVSLYAPRLVQWTRSGYIGFRSSLSDFSRLGLAGQYAFEPSGLNPGDNFFSVQARDSADNKSPTSGKILIRKIFPDLPDLVVETDNITVLPSAPLVGETVRYTVSVRNAGTVKAPSTTLSAIMVAADGSVLALLDREPLLYMESSQVRSLTFDWSPSQPGKYTLVVIADPDDLVLELDELTNNVALKDVLVANDDAPRLTIQTDRSAYEANSPVSLDSELVTYGQPFEGTVEMFLTDTQGYSVARLRSEPVTTASSSGTLSYVDAWNTADTFAGTYVAHARLLSAEGEVVTQDSTEFSILPSATVEMTASADAAVYGAHAPVRAAGTFSYTYGNRVLNEAQANLRITGPEGAVVVESTSRLGTLLPGVGGDLVVDWNTRTHAPGPYTVSALITVAGEPFASAEHRFEIHPDGTHFSGELLIDQAVAGIGEPINVSWSLSNLGNIDVTGVPLRIALVDPYGPEVDAILKSVDVPLASAAEGQVAFSTAGLELKRYSVVLRQGVDNAILARESVSIADLTPPQVQIAAPAEGAYVGGQGEVAIRATDAHTRVEQVEFRLDGGEWLVAPLRDSRTGFYGRPLPALSEGGHTLEARATDEPGNVGSAGTRAFIVDTTAPEILIDGVEEDGYYNVDVAPRVTVSDAALTEQRITLDGEAFASGATIGAEGEYMIAVYAEDKAGNVAEKSLTFTIDKTAPTVTIGGVAPGEYYNHGVTPSVDVDDTNPGQLKLSLNGEPYAAGTPITEEGFHRFEATAIDRAGNSGSAVVMFTVDTTPPAIMVIYPENELTTRERSIRIEGLTEAASSVLLVTGSVESSTLADLEGQFSFAGAPLVIGRNVIALTATDRAGNVGETHVIYVNILPPVELEGYVRAPRSVLLWAPTGGSEPESGSVAFIESVLAEKGYTYETTYSGSDFIEALRSQRFSAVLVLEPHRRAGEKELRLKVSDELDAELRLMTASGTGVVWIKTQPDASERWDDLFGMQVLGSIPQVNAVAFSGERLSKAGTWALEGRAMKVRTTDGVAVGSLLPIEGAPALVLNSYGEGTAALVAFDPVEMSDAEAARDILADIVALVSSGRRRLLPGSFAEIIWLAKEVDPPLNVQLDEHLASGMRFLEVGDGAIVSPRDATWQRTIREPESEPFAALVGLGSTVGTYPVRATVSLLIDGVPLYPEEEYLVLKVSDDIASLQSAVLSRLDTLVVAPQDELKLRNALTDIRSALREDTENLEGLERAIGYLLSAESELIAMSSPYRDAEAALGALLRSYQLLASGMDWTDGGR